MSAGDVPTPSSTRDVLFDFHDAIDTVRDAVLAVQQNELATDLVIQARARLGETAPFFDEALATLRRWDNIFSVYAGGPDPRVKPRTDAPDAVFDAATPAALWQIVAARGQSSILDQAGPANPKGGRPAKTRRSRVLLKVARILEHQGRDAPIAKTASLSSSCRAYLRRSASKCQMTFESSSHKSTTTTGAAGIGATAKSP